MADVKEKKQEKPENEDAELEEMIRVGLHFGHKKTKKHPKMDPYLFGVRSGVNIIDVSKTKEMLSRALNFASSLISENKMILLVGTKVQLKDIVRETAEECGLPYVNERWLGGTITNFGNIKKRVDYLKEMEKKKEEGELEKYTKKEKLKIDGEISALKTKMEGLKLLDKVPAAVFVLDITHDDLAVKEAKAKGLKVIAITDTDANPELADYPIPANDDALLAVSYILGKFKEVVIEAKNRIKTEDIAQN